MVSDIMTTDMRAGGATVALRRASLSRSPSAPALDPETASAVVSGAGTAAANGTYERDGSFGGRARYTMGLSEISWGGSSWNINDPDGFPLYLSNDDVEYPWLATTWEPSDGTPPMPTVSIG